MKQKHCKQAIQKTVFTNHKPTDSACCFAFTAITFARMKVPLIIFRMITFILLPVAIIFSVFDLIALISALANPAILIGVFLMACMVIYIIASFIFLTKGIDGKRQCKPSLRDWIRVNSFVSLGFSIMIILEYISLLTDKTIVAEITKQAMMQPGMPAEMSSVNLQGILMGIMLVFFVISVLLAIHILICFRLLRQYSYIFNPDKFDFEK